MEKETVQKTISVVLAGADELIVHIGDQAFDIDRNDYCNTLCRKNGGIIIFDSADEILNFMVNHGWSLVKKIDAGITPQFIMNAERSSLSKWNDEIEHCKYCTKMAFPRKRKK